MKRFKKIRGARYRKERNETNDCAVIALSILGRMTYAEAHALCKMHGRPLGKGMYTRDLIKAMQAAGLKVEEVTTHHKEKFVQCEGYSFKLPERDEPLRKPNGSKYTPKTIGERLKRGYYLCVTRGHFFSVVNGDVEDWSKGTKKHVLYTYKITKPRG